jgi:hypothetical protein
MLYTHTFILAIHRDLFTVPTDKKKKSEDKDKKIVSQSVISFLWGLLPDFVKWTIKIVFESNSSIH